MVINTKYQHMKTIITAIFISLMSLSMQANETSSASKLSLATKPTPTLLLKFASKPAKAPQFCYTLQISLNEQTISYFNPKNTKTRFAYAGARFENRFKNRNNNADLNYIVEKNRLYLNTKENLKQRSF